MTPPTLIIHAPVWVMVRAATIAAALIAGDAIARSAPISVVEGHHKYSVRRNKSSVTVWHSQIGDARE